MATMTKKQKIWLWVFIAMFAVPEILWSPVANFLYIFYRGGNVPVIFRDNFLVHTDYRRLMIMVVFMQIVGSFLSLTLIYKLSFNIIIKILLFILFLLFFVLSLGVFIILSATLNMGF